MSRTLFSIGYHNLLSDYATALKSLSYLTTATGCDTRALEPIVNEITTLAHKPLSEEITISGGGYQAGREHAAETAADYLEEIRDAMEAAGEYNEIPLYIVALTCVQAARVLDSARYQDPPKYGDTTSTAAYLTALGTTFEHIADEIDKYKQEKDVPLQVATKLYAVRLDALRGNILKQTWHVLGRGITEGFTDAIQYATTEIREAADAAASMIGNTYDFAELTQKVADDLTQIIQNTPHPPAFI